MAGERQEKRWGGWLFAAGCFMFLGTARAGIEDTHWGPFEFPLPVGTQREALAMYEEARAPVVVAIRFLAAAPPGTPWINHHLACGTAGEIRKDFNASLVRGSTFLAYQLTAALEQGLAAASDLREGRVPAQAVRYAGPVAIVLEPVMISANGEPLPPPVVVEPHLRVFVGVTPPRCVSDATGAFGRVGELAGGFLITAAPVLELGWPTWSPSALGQRVVMGTVNLLADGFCCGQESAFGLDSLSALFEYRDYQTKGRFRNTLRNLGTSRQRNAAWSMRVRDAFGVPDRFPEQHLRELRYGSGRIASSEFAIMAAPSESFAAGLATPMVNLADIILGLAWHAQSRVGLISPTLLESYDPQRKYSFVGWPEEFRETFAEDEEVDPDGRVLEVFGAERRFSFVGDPAVIEENIAFSFAAWRLELDFVTEHVTRPFLAEGAPGSPLGQAREHVVSEETTAARRRRPQTFRSLFTSGPVAADQAGYVTALEILDRPFTLPGYGSLASERPLPPGDALRTLRWAGREATVPARSLEELRDGLVRLYAERYRMEPQTSPAVP